VTWPGGDGAEDGTVRRDGHLRAPPRAGTGVAASVSSEGGRMIFRVLLYLFLMLGLAVRERVVRVR
jgi:hypothetical protein